jgi:hypothetical protein
MWIEKNQIIDILYFIIFSTDIDFDFMAMERF